MLFRSDWDNQLEATEFGWPGFFRTLRIYLTHFRGQRSAIMQFVAPFAGAEAEAWETLTAALSLKGLSVGLGWIFVGERNRNAASLPYFRLNQYDRFDALLAYRGQIGQRRYKLQLNANNITQENYVNNNRVPGNPETEYRFSVEYAF